MYLVILLFGFYLIITGSFPHMNWGPLRGNYAGTGKFIKVSPLFGRISGGLFVFSFFIKGHSTTLFFIAIGLAFIFLIISMFT